MLAPKTSSTHITHSAMHYHEDDTSPVNLFNFPRILHMFESHINKYVEHS